MSRLITSLFLLWLAAPLVAQPRSREFDAAWTSYFGPEYFFYLAVKTAAVDGPLMHRPDLPGTEDAPPGSPAVAVRALLEEAKKEKVVESNFAELVPDGFAVGLASGADKKDPAGLFVAPKNPRLMRFYDWIIGHYQKRNGADSIKTVKVEGFPATRFLKNPKGPAVIVVGETALVISNQEEAAGRALARAKDSKGSLASAKFYKRARGRVGADAAMFALLDPLPFLSVLEAAATGSNREEQVKKIQEAKKSVEALDAVLLALTAEKAATRVDVSVLLNTGAPAYRNLRALAGQSGVKAASFVSAQTPLLLAMVRPAEVPAGVAPEMREGMTAQVQQLKGFLQTQTGLDFDVDVAPWWGNEIALALEVPEHATPEGALLFEAKDKETKAALAAVDKAARHLAVAQNRTFVDRKVGEATVKIAEPPPGGGPSPVNPTLALAGGYVMLATGADVVTDAIETKEKLAGTPSFVRLASAVPPEKTGLVFYMKTDLLLKAQEGKPVDPGSPALKVKKFAEDVDSVALNMGWADEESVKVTILFNGR